jgi:LacI family transcriptional regulator
VGINFENDRPLYLQIVDDIKYQIKVGILKAGDKVESHRELAERYKVSIITIRKGLAELIRDGYLFSRVGKGTYVAGKRRNTTASSSHTIGFVLQDINSPFFSLIGREAENAAFREDWNVLYTKTSDHLEKEESQIDLFRSMQVDGLIIASMTHIFHANNTIRNLHNEGFPYVMVSYIHDPDIYFVGADHEYGGYIATRHLIEEGYKRIGYINGELGNIVGDLRCAGFLQAMKEHDRAVRDGDVFTLPRGGEWFNFNSGYEVGNHFYQLDDRPDAVFVYNDLVALGFQRAVLEHGLSIPEDVAIVGFDDIANASHARVPLTTVRQPVEEIGRIAVETIMGRKNNEKVPVKTVLKPDLIVRASSVESNHLANRS